MLKVKWVHYDSSDNQWIGLSELKDTACKMVKIFLRGKERERVSLKPRKRIQEIVLLLRLVAFYIYGLVKVKVINSRVTKYKKVVKHCT